jgi:hypothetical protein
MTSALKLQGLARSRLRRCSGQDRAAARFLIPLQNLLAYAVPQSRVSSVDVGGAPVSTEYSNDVLGERQRLYAEWQDANARAAALIRESSSGAPKGPLLAHLQAEEAKATSLVVRYRRLDSQIFANGLHVALS